MSKAKQIKTRHFVNDAEIVSSVVDAAEKLLKDGLQPIILAKSMNPQTIKECLHNLSNRVKEEVRKRNLDRKIPVGVTIMSGAENTYAYGCNAIVFAESGMFLSEEGEQEHNTFSSMSSIKVMVDVTTRPEHKAKFLNQFFPVQVNERTDLPTEVKRSSPTRLRDIMEEMPPVRHKVGKTFREATSEVYKWMFKNHPELDPDDKDYEEADRLRKVASKEGRIKFDSKTGLWTGVRYREDA